jgi:hypothetical protein
MRLNFEQLQIDDALNKLIKLNGRAAAMMMIIKEDAHGSFKYNAHLISISFDSDRRGKNESLFQTLAIKPGKRDNGGSHTPF